MGPHTQSESSLGHTFTMTCLVQYVVHTQKIKEKSIERQYMTEKSDVLNTGANRTNMAK